ncbi:hypothetical protein SAMN04487934_11438 [Eubacterium ruminantium]|nr:hypothetical protein SAMN04487934_11438 [Eubacterium ruminantium]
MKDQYVADIGDYGKYALLREFACNGIKVGVNWYLTEDDDSSDGSIRKYLFNDKNGIGTLDPELYHKLQLINAKGDRKSIVDIKDSGIIPKAIYYSDMIDSNGNPYERKTKREDWFLKSLKPLDKADLIFLDPDNGLLTNGGAGKRNAEKYVLLDEIEQYFKGIFGQRHNVVYYCHKGRRKQEAWMRYMMCMSRLLPEARSIILTYHKGTQRSYVFLIHDGDYDNYRRIIDSFLERWERIFTEEKLN